MSSPKIALCFSGQPRTWEKCYSSWSNLFNGFEVDTFCHFWNYNSLPSLVQSQGIRLESTIVSEEERVRIIDTLKPKKIVFQTFNPNVLVADTKVHFPIAPFSHSQFYSLMKVAHLKRRFEIENDFQYDIVVRMRSDLLFMGPAIDFSMMRPNTLFTVHNAPIKKAGDAFRIGDIFFFADSFTFDQVAGFYNSFNYIEANIAVPGQTMYAPELALYYFISSKGIENHQLFHHYEMKVMRTQQQLELVGHLNDYETA